MSDDGQLESRRMHDDDCKFWSKIQLELEESSLRLSNRVFDLVHDYEYCAGLN
jgi:hypothetical protein